MADITVQDLIRQEAQKAGVPPELALAVAEQESDFNPTAVNPTTQATGVFQFIPATAKARGIDPADPTQNIRGGVGYLRELLDRHQGDLQKVLAEYGGVKTDQKYVPGVLARIGKFAGSAPPTPAATSTPAQGPPTPRGRAATSIGMASMLGLDPRTSQGRRNLAGGAGALAATALAPELALPALAARLASAVIPIGGAYFGGALEQAGENAVSNAPPTLESFAKLHEAGKQQAGYEAGGQVGGAVLKGIGRRVMASSVSKKVSQGLSDALDAVGSRLQSKRPSVTPAQAGELFHEVTQGPAQSVKDQLGRDVEAAAAQGPPIPVQPLKDRLDELSAQITPMASHQQMPVIPGFSPAQTQALVAKNPQLMLPPDHPLPGALAAVRETLGDATEIDFEDAHKIKRLLDDVTNWESPAKKQVQQLTKGFRQTLRSQMASHQPYNEATEAYGTVAKLYHDVGASKLHNAILSKPSAVVDKIDWRNPATLNLVKEITALPTDQAGAQQGEAAFHAVRSAWTNENLIALGPKRMANEIDRIEASNSGQEFVKSMYGDPAGQTQWQNLKQLAKALRDTQAESKQFAQTSLARATEPAGVVRDIGYMMMPGHGITRLGAGSRVILGRGSSATEMLEWASRTPATTQFLIKHVLTGPNPGMALADMARWFATKDETPMAVSHDQGPPAPQSLRR